MFKIIFALISLLVNVEATCTHLDIAIWRSDPASWNKNFETIASNAFGNKKMASTKFQKKYPTMTPECVECQGELVFCGMAKCTTDCVVNRLAPKCRTCIETHCLGPYYTCIGTSDESLIPIPPWAL